MYLYISFFIPINLIPHHQYAMVTNTKPTLRFKTIASKNNTRPMPYSYSDLIYCKSMKNEIVFL